MAQKKKTHVFSKWVKTRVLLRDPRIRAYIPETKRLTAATLRRMLARYSMVYIKPIAGTYGNGVIRVEFHRNSKKCTYSFQLLKTKRMFRSFPSLFRSILRYKWKTSYLVQKGIPLLMHQGRRFDIRVMVQKNPKKQWETTGMIGRVAHPAKIVTNYHSGGKPTDIRTLLRPYVKNKGLPEYTNILAHVGTTAAAVLGRAYPGVNMVGADIGVDRGLKPWIIELNTNPDPYIFRHLKDKRIYRKVFRYARALGRIPMIKKPKKAKKPLKIRRRRAK
jgi:hypothetical protein